MTTDSATQKDSHDRRNLLLRFIDWLRVGYPAGVPDADASAMLYVLKHDLTDADITHIAHAMISAHGADAPLADGVITEKEINDYIERTMAQKPTADDIARVRNKLREGGFPVEDDDHADV